MPLELQGYTGKFHKASEWIIRLSVTNLLWILFNVPMVFLILSVLVVQSVGELIVLGAITFVLAPFVFYPATTAMFAIIREVFLDEDVKLFRSFLKYYKDNYVRSMVGGFIFGLMWLILILDYYFFITHVSELFFYVFTVLACLLVVSTLHFFSITVHIHTKLFQAIKNAMLITIVNPLLTLGIGLVSGIIIYLSLQIFTFLLLLFTGSFIAFISFFGFYKFFIKIEYLKEQNNKTDSVQMINKA